MAQMWFVSSPLEYTSPFHSAVWRTLSILPLTAEVKVSNLRKGWLEGSPTGNSFPGQPTRVDAAAPVKQVTHHNKKVTNVEPSSNGPRCHRPGRSHAQTPVHL